MIIFPTFPQQQVMDPETLRPGAIGAKLSRTTGASPNVTPGETQEQCRHQLFHCDAAIVATQDVNLDTHLQTVRKTGRSNSMKQDTNGCESIHIDVDNVQLMI